jgi:site-specific recombinase XerC
LDAYLELVAARARPNTLLAQAYDLKVFFTVVDVGPVDVVAADVLEFISAQRQPRVAANVVRIEDGESGLSGRTIKRRLATLQGFYDYLVVRGDVAVNPVPRGLASRRGGQRAVRGVPLIRAPGPCRG